MKTLRLLLGDQLNIKHPWFSTVDKAVTYCLFEMKQETGYTTHHITKVAAFFAAMRRFAETLKSDGHTVIYYKLNDAHNTGNLTKNLSALIKYKGFKRFEYQLPDEYRLDEELKGFCQKLAIPFKAADTAHFYTTRHELRDFFEGKKQLLMENFYRNMRKKHGILMQTATVPEGTQWNYDHDNRNAWNDKHPVPKVPDFKHDVSGILTLLEQEKIKTMGRAPKNGLLNQPLTRAEALQRLKFFCEHQLEHFGTYQDAMHTQQVMLFHSDLSFALNVKLISPKDVVTTVVNYYHKHKGTVDIAQVEGFIRQVIGWREYVRGIYWLRMPEFSTENFFGNKNPLPDFYWTGTTKMNCLKHCVNNSLDNAYAHHIQRLMVLGNFALLAQVNPAEVDQWYLGVYIDAVEWVQLPNTRGMSQFADGGVLATKPYISSGNYINKMSNYCKECAYNVKTRTDKDSCPFNSLYWNFLHQKQDQLGRNARIAFMYKQLEKIPQQEMEKILQRAHSIIKNPDAY